MARKKQTTSMPVSKKLAKHLKDTHKERIAQQKKTEEYMIKRWGHK